MRLIFFLSLFLGSILSHVYAQERLLNINDIFFYNHSLYQVTDESYDPHMFPSRLYQVGDSEEMPFIITSLQDKFFKVSEILGPETYSITVALRKSLRQERAFQTLRTEVSFFCKEKGWQDYAFRLEESTHCKNQSTYVFTYYCVHFFKATE